MKLLDIMKKYDHCLVRESAKLTKIYNMILKESESCEEKIDEEVCPDCGEDPCVCDKVDETEEEDAEVSEGDMIPAEDFFKEACKDGEECDECGLIPEEDFIREASEDIEENDMLRNHPHNAHVDDPRGVISEKEDEDEGEKPSKKSSKKEECDESDEEGKMMSAKEFFAEAEKECKKDVEGINEEEEMMSAAEFFSNSEEVDETESEEKADEVNEEEGIILGPDWKKTDAHELLPEAEEKKLEESLKSYRRKNHRLFNG